MSLKWQYRHIHFTTLFAFLSVLFAPRSHLYQCVPINFYNIHVNTSFAFLYSLFWAQGCLKDILVFLSLIHLSYHFLSVSVCLSLCLSLAYSLSHVSHFCFFSNDFKLGRRYISCLCACLQALILSLTQDSPCWILSLI